MGRPLYIKELAARPFPHGLIGHMLMPYERFLRVISFADNEIGDNARATELCDSKVIQPINRRLLRNAKRLKLVAITVVHSRHHTLTVQFVIRHGLGWRKGDVAVSLFVASKKAIAMERKAEEKGEDHLMVAPRRGAAPAKKNKRKRWKKLAKAIVEKPAKKAAKKPKVKRRKAK